MNQPTEPEFLDDVGLKKPDRSLGYVSPMQFEKNWLAEQERRSA